MRAVFNICIPGSKAAETSERELRMGSSMYDTYKGGQNLLWKLSKSPYMHAGAKLAKFSWLIIMLWSRSCEQNGPN
jgi:hypothetical protein